jgi:hypothetical protein
MIRISSSNQFLDALEKRRPDGTPHASTKAVAIAAREFAVLAAPVIEDAFPEGEDRDNHMIWASDAVRSLALNLALMAEDLLSGGCLWRVIEENNQRLFGTPLPLVCKAGEAALPAMDVLDERRFRFYLHTVWSLVIPDAHVFPDDAILVRLAGMAARMFTRLRAKAVSAEAMLTAPTGEPDIDGAEVKAKLLWLACASYLLELEYVDYAMGHSKPDASLKEQIAVTEAFLCDVCTRWSGLGALELLADAARMEPADRADLLSWSEKHFAVYRVESVTPMTPPPAVDGPMVLLTLTNVINEQRYEAPMFTTVGRCMFKEGKMVLGALSRWRGVWRWMGSQTIVSEKRDVEALRERFRSGYGQIAYRYCPDLLKIVQEAEARAHADFLRFYGDELKVQPDGMTVMADERRRWREASARAIEAEAAKAGVAKEAGVAGEAAKAGRAREPVFDWPEALVETKNPVAVFYVAGSGVEYLRRFDMLCAALRTKSFSEMGELEREVLDDFVKGAAISPEFVRRVAREWGSDGIMAYYCGDGDAFADEQRAGAVEYLIRCYKGAAFRRRYPSMSVVGAD